MTYNLILRGEMSTERLAAALAALVSLPIDSVDVGADSDEDRNWSAPVNCTYVELAGDVQWRLDIYLDESIVNQPNEAQAAAWLARQLQTVILYPAEVAPPSAFWLVGPDGRHIRARLYEDDDDSDILTCWISAVEYPVAMMPALPVMPIPEVIREYRVAAPITEWLRGILRPLLESEKSMGKSTAGAQEAWYACTRLGAWESMVNRLASGWPPDGWYPAVYYQQDLETRDELAQMCRTYQQVVRGPLEAALVDVDRQFKALTQEDLEGALAAELGSKYAGTASSEWWWRRIPHPLPWSRQPGRPSRNT